MALAAHLLRDGRDDLAALRGQLGAAPPDPAERRALVAALLALGEVCQDAAVALEGWQHGARRVRVRPPRCRHGGFNRAAV